MRIIATSDTHYPPFVKRQDVSLRTTFDPTIEIPDGDVFIHAGDLMRTGYPNEWEAAIEWLGRLPHKTKIFVPGNHDFHLKVYPGPALQDLRSVGVTCVGLPGNNSYSTVILPNGMDLLGLPYVVDLPRWAFSITEDDLAKHLQKVWSDHHDIIVSHSPVYGHLDKTIRGKNAGVKIYAEYLKFVEPKIWISGHVHENYGYEKANGCDMYNVAMCNREYKHANSPMIIDV